MNFIEYPLHAEFGVPRHEFGDLIVGAIVKDNKGLIVRTILKTSTESHEQFVRGVHGYIKQSADLDAEVRAVADEVAEDLLPKPQEDFP